MPTKQPPQFGEITQADLLKACAIKNRNEVLERLGFYLEHGSPNELSRADQEEADSILADGDLAGVAPLLNREAALDRYLRKVDSALRKLLNRHRNPMSALE